MSQDNPDLDRRLTELQAQINRLSLSLHLWHERQERLQPVESRLNYLSEQCSDIIDRWAVAGERQSQVVGELEQRLMDWTTAEARTQQDAARMEDLQRVIEHEWSALKEGQEGSANELRDQAARLTEACVVAATQATTGFDRTEARLADLQTDMHDRLTELTGQVQLAVAELKSLARPQAGPALTAGTGSWPLDGVVRLHNQLRGTVDGAAADGPLLLATPEIRLLPEATAALAERIDTLERALNDGQDEVRRAAERSARTSRLWWAAVVLLAASIGGGSVLVTRLQRQVAEATARVSQAQQQALAVTEAANQQVVAARQDAAQQISDARDTALKAQTISDVLAAPDLVRYSLVSRDPGAGFSGQALWSRSRGLVFSGSRLPAPPPDSTYQIWILTSTDAVSVATFVPDGNGRYTLATSTPPKVAPPIAGLAVTVEHSGGSDHPTGITLLARAE